VQIARAEKKTASGWAGIRQKASESRGKKRVLQKKKNLDSKEKPPVEGAERGNEAGRGNTLPGESRLVPQENKKRKNRDDPVLIGKKGEITKRQGWRIAE